MKTAVMFNDGMREYGFGTRQRFDDFLVAFYQALGDNPDFELVEAREATDEELCLVHDREFVRDIERLCAQSIMRDPDTPLRPGLDRAARIIVGASLQAGELVRQGRYVRAVGLGGGLHHARRNQEAGFCIFNDVAICARNLVQNHAVQRILIIDTDAHAGDGTAEIFYQDPGVLFISIHQDPHTLYPGWGFVHQIGSGAGRGYTVNVPLPRGAAHDAYQLVFDQIVLPLAREFQPQIILRSGGSDPHYADELTVLGLTLEGLRMIGSKVRQAADEVCQGRVVDLPGSGYQSQVLPYGWLALICGLSGIDVTLEEPVPPPRWLRRDYALEKTQDVVTDVRNTLGKYWRCFG